MSKSASWEMDRYIVQTFSAKILPRWAVDVAMDWFLLIGTLALASYLNNILFYILAIFIIGNRQHALGILGHEGTHYCLHKNKKLNDYLSDFLCFFPLGLTVSGYRSMHFTHHSHAKTDRDPEMMHKNARADQWALPLSLKNLGWNCFKDLFGNSVIDYIFIVLNAKPKYKSSYVLLIMFHVAAISCGLWYGLYIPLLLWYGSLLTTFMMFFRLRVWLEHQGENETNRLDLKWWEAAMLAPHNIWYHYEHHAFPSVPYTKLKEVREMMKGQQEVISLGRLIQELQTAKS